ncbi:MAG: hypothetical protein R6X25_07280 [Candidatus Krumholzibacteriia bacterium]
MMTDDRTKHDLHPLDLEEVEQRLEVSPLLVAGADDPLVGGDTTCCSCKLPPRPEDPDVGE